jgi:hypothetical protein
VIFSWRVQRKVSLSLTLQHDRVIYLLENCDANRALIHRYIDVYEYPDGRIEIRADGQSLRYERYDRLGQIDASAIVENKRLSHVLKAAAVLQAQRDNRRRSGTPSRTNQGQAPHPKRPAQGTKQASQFTSGDLERAVLATFARPEAPPPAKSHQRLFATT